MGREAKAKGERRSLVSRYGDLRSAHRAIAWGGKRCAGCGSDKIAVRIKSLARVEDLMRVAPDFLGALAAKHDDGQVPVIPTCYGAMTMIGDVYACDLCKHAAEVAAAHPPKGLKLEVLVEVDRGPEPDKAVVQVPRGEG
jgi:hypothetical protein